MHVIYGYILKVAPCAGSVTSPARITRRRMQVRIKGHKTVTTTKLCASEEIPHKILVIYIHNSNQDTANLTGLYT